MRETQKVAPGPLLCVLPPESDRATTRSAETLRSLLTSDWHHLEGEDFPSSRLADPPLDEVGRERLTFALGEMIRRLHEATATFSAPTDARWYEWCGRSLGDSERIVGHCDLAPWNIVCRDGMPVALIDFDFAGPTDPRVDLAQACWSCAKLHDEIVARAEGLLPLHERAETLRAIVDGYGLAAPERIGFIDLILEFIIHFNAWQADDFNITPQNRPSDPVVGWAFAWVSRSAAWIHRNRDVLQRTIE